MALIKPIDEIRVPAGVPDGTEDALGFGEQGCGQKRQRTDGNNLIHTPYYNKKTRGNSAADLLPYGLIA